MGVDSNVLIFERIREELRQGKPVRLAIDAGYDKALLTIVDSHVTTLITGFALFLFGTGPIKGFAVTLVPRHRDQSLHGAGRDQSGLRSA